MQIFEHRSRSGHLYRRALLSVAASLWLSTTHEPAAQALLPNPTPEIYVNHNRGGSQVISNGQLFFDGQQFTCGRFPTVLDPLLNDYAAAPYKGFMILNPKLIQKVATPVKLWIFHHECGHLIGIRDEAKADCYSAQRGKLAGWLTPQGLQQVCDFISAGRADSTHPSGPDRCAAIKVCYQQQRSGLKVEPDKTGR